MTLMKRKRHIPEQIVKNFAMLARNLEEEKNSVKFSVSSKLARRPALFINKSLAPFPGATST
jgi:hypothetical protein